MKPFPHKGLRAEDLVRTYLDPELPLEADLDKDYQKIFFKTSGKTAKPKPGSESKRKPDPNPKPKS